MVFSGSESRFSNYQISKLQNYQIAKWFSVAVVVTVIPVVFLAPAMFVLIPPTMVLAPAAFAGCVQLAALMIGFAAVAAMALDGLVQFVFGMLDAALAVLFGFRV
jgi:hypothetical protein